MLQIQTTHKTIYSFAALLKKLAFPLLKLASTMKNIKIALAVLAFASTSIVNAETLTFDSPGSLGVTLGGKTQWNGTGGGHLFNNYWSQDDYIFFDAPVLLNSFDMNFAPWEGYNGGHSGIIDVEALGAGGAVLWSQSIDLNAYNTWNNWLTVQVDTASVETLKFYATGAWHINRGFWPSIDNIVINEGGSENVPDSGSTALLLGAGLTGLMLMRKRAKESRG